MWNEFSILKVSTVKKDMKRVICAIFMLIVSTISYADRIDDRIYERDLDKMYGIDNASLRDALAGGKNPFNPNPQNFASSQSDVYRNTMTYQERVKQAGFFNLTVAEYVRRDELAESQCAQYKDTIIGLAGPLKVGGASFFTCSYSFMLQISPQEVDKRRSNVEKYCNNRGLPDEKLLTCIKDYIVMGKRNVLGFAF